MARGNNPGKDFDDQWNDSARRGQERARRGEGPWEADKYLERINAKPVQGPKHAGEPKGCSDKAIALLAVLGGLAWALQEIVQRVA